MYKFDAKDATEKCIAWIQKFFEENGPTCNAVIGISGGKDSSIVAALCVKALGKDRVIGVLMPNGEQYDIADSHGICDILGIKRYVINIKDAFKVKHTNGQYIFERELIDITPPIKNDVVSQSSHNEINMMI